MYYRESETERPRFYVNVEKIDSRAERLKQTGGSVLVGKRKFLAWVGVSWEPIRKTMC